MRKVEQINALLYSYANTSEEVFSREYVGKDLHSFAVPVENDNLKVIERDKLQIAGCNGYTNGITTISVNMDDFESANVVNFKTRSNDGYKDEDFKHTVVLSVEPIYYGDMFGLVSDILIAHNIVANGKITTVYRNPSLEITVSDISDLTKIINGFKVPNIDNMLVERIPFLEGDRGIGLLIDWDNTIPFVDVLSTCIEKYISEKRDNNQLHQVATSDFLHFLQKHYGKNEGDNKRLKVIAKSLEGIIRSEEISDIRMKRKEYLENSKS